MRKTDVLLKYLSTAEVAEMTGLSGSYITKLRHFGGGPAYVKLRGCVRYRVSDVDAWMASHLVNSTAESAAR